MPLAYDPTMSGRLIQLFRHLECQNPSIVSDSIGIPRWLPKMGKKVRSRSRRSLNHIEEDNEIFGYICEICHNIMCAILI